MEPIKKGRGGARKGAGRPKGSVSKLDSFAREEALRSGQSPLEYMLEVMRNSEDEARRLDAAKAAAPYVHARLNAVSVSGDQDNPLNHVHRIERVIVDPKKG